MRQEAAYIIAFTSGLSWFSLETSSLFLHLQSSYASCLESNFKPTDPDPDLSVSSGES